MINKKRFIGIDSIKICATYAVVWIHSNGGEFHTEDLLASVITAFCAGFAVPFFLATSFYLIAQRVFFSDKQYGFVTRINVLLIPYLAWTLIHSIFRILKYLLAHSPDKLKDFFADPAAVIFLGGSATQIYYIPLLISGTISVFLIQKFIPKSKLEMKLVLGLFVLSSLLYQTIIDSGNSFYLGPNIAFANILNLTSSNLSTNQFIRVSAVITSWALRCIPYIFAAIILNNLIAIRKVLKFNAATTIVYFSMAFVFNILTACNLVVFPAFVSELTIAYCFLMLAISMSAQIEENKFITNLGSCTFGIYLVHDLIVQFVRPLVAKFQPLMQPIFSIFICTTLSFTISWIVVVLLSKNNLSRKILFAQ